MSADRAISPLDPWTGTLIRLRGLRTSDWELFHRWNQEPDWSFADRRSYPPASEDRTRIWLEEQVRAAGSGDEMRVIIERLDRTPVGTIDTNRCDKHARTFWYGIAISSKHRRQGFAREAIQLAARYYFRELGYQKVTTSVWSFNEASRRLHESMGFTLEGRLRRTHFRDGQWFDELLYGMTTEEFTALSPD